MVQGIGQTSESSISVVPSSVHYSTHPPPVLDEAENQVVYQQSIFKWMQFSKNIRDCFFGIECVENFKF